MTLSRPGPAASGIQLALFIKITKNTNDNNNNHLLSTYLAKPLYMDSFI